MILAIAVPPEGDIILTADRDEKIRISRYPRAHNIEGYCLGHTEFVSRICLAPAAFSGALVSCGGDGSVRLWDYRAVVQRGALLADPTASTDSAGPVTLLACAHRLPLAVAAWEGDGDHSATSVSVLRLTLAGITRVGTVQLGHVPTALAFDADDRLWVAVDDDAAPLRCYSWHADEERLSATCFGEVDGTFFARVQGECLFTDASARQPKLAPLKKHLTRVNVTQYLARKNERLETKKAETRQRHGRVPQCHTRKRTPRRWTVVEDDVGEPFWRQPLVNVMAWMCAFVRAMCSLRQCEPLHSWAFTIFSILPASNTFPY
eukprot:Opistho-2@91588